MSNGDNDAWMTRDGWSLCILKKGTFPPTLQGLLCIVQFTVKCPLLTAHVEYKVGLRLYDSFQKKTAEKRRYVTCPCEDGNLVFIHHTSYSFFYEIEKKRIGIVGCLCLSFSCFAERD